MFFSNSIFIFFVYGSPNKGKGKLLWDALRQALPTDNSPCLLMGDFNAILSPSDKKSIHSIGKRCNLFGSFVDSCNL